MNKTGQRIALLATGLTALATGYGLYERAAEQRLFGWLTLPFILSVWGFIVALRGSKYDSKPLLMSSLSGLLFYLGFPNMPFTFLLFGAFVPLLWLEKDYAEAAALGAPKKGLMRQAYHSFVLWNVLTTWWVGNAGLLPGMIANFLNAFFMLTAFWLFHKQGLWLQRLAFFKQSPLAAHVVKYTLFVANWLGFEYLHLNWDLSWSWLTLGNAFAENTSWIQWYEYTGVFGGSIWILIGNILIFNFLQIKKDKKFISKMAIATGVLWWVAPLSISYFLGQKAAQLTATQTAEVIAIQPNYEPHYEKFSLPESTQWQRFEQLVNSQIDSTTDYVLFPETSFDLRNQADFNTHPIFNNMMALTEKYPKMHLISGVDAFKIYAQQVRTAPPMLPPTVRVHDYADGSQTYWESYNAALQLNAQTANRPFYKKSKLVPGPEILPFGSLLSWLKPLFKKFGGTLGGLGTQAERTAFWNKDGQRAVAPVICYESIYGDFCAGFARSGAQALFVLTNDGWWDDTPGYVQHLKFAKLRAIELRRTVVRAANSGSSAFINPQGIIEQQTAYAVAAAIKQTVPLHQGLSFYAKNGDYLGILGSILSVLGLIIGGLAGLLRPKLAAI